MAFRTKLDYSDNRQINQRQRTFTTLEGGSIIGVPFSALTSGPDTTQTGITENIEAIISTFSGNNTTSNYTWYDDRMSVGEPFLSAWTSSNSGATQIVDVIYGSSSATTIDDNVVNLSYSGVAYDLYIITMVQLGPSTYSGTVKTDNLDIYSATSLDYTGSTVWLENPEITKTKKLIITNNATPTYVWTCLDAAGNGEWQVSSSGGTGSTSFWSAGTGTDAIVVNNSGGDASGTLSVSEGSGTTASGIYSHAEGRITFATKDSSHAEGIGGQATGIASHAEGSNTIASGDASHAEGEGTTASGTRSHAEGQASTASGDYSHAEGHTTIASGVRSHAEGDGTTASTAYSHAEGLNTIASGSASHAEGATTTASGLASHAEGNGTTASGSSAHSEGFNTIAGGIASHAEGATTEASGNNSHAEGANTIASGSQSHAEGIGSDAIGNYSHAEGWLTNAIGNGSHAEGLQTTASGIYSHAEGNGTTASGSSAHSEGQTTVAGGDNSHAGGYQTTASGDNSFVHGSGSTASGLSTVVFGDDISGVTDNMVYVPDLTIDGLVSTDPLATDANGKIIAGASDARLKTNIKELDSALDTILNLRGVSFEWTEESNMGAGITKYGLIAQEVQEVIPDMVRLRAKTDDTLTLSYTEIVPWLIEAVKELSSDDSPLLKRKELILETQTIASEDSNIELNFGGSHETSLNGGISVVKGINNETNSIFQINSDGDWCTNNYIIPYGLVIPEFAPTSTNDEKGKLGEITRDDDYIYIKGNGGWKRTNLETF